MSISDMNRSFHFEPKKLSWTVEGRHSTSPNNNQKFRIIENGEVQVVNKAARQHWNFTRDNAKHLMKHMYDLKFAKEPNQMRGYSGYQILHPTSVDQPNVPLSRIQVGLSHLNCESAD